MMRILAAVIAVMFVLVIAGLSLAEEATSPVLSHQQIEKKCDCCGRDESPAKNITPKSDERNVGIHMLKPSESAY